MFAAIEEFSFSLLLMISQFLGVQPLPAEPSPDWQVVQEWKELPDKTYELILKSETIPKHCAENPTDYVIFPQVLLGQYEIYGDADLVATNSMGQRWHLKSQNNREVVSCKKLTAKHEVAFYVRSYLKYYTSLMRYPYFSKVFPRRQFFYGPIYLVVAGILLCLVIVFPLFLFSVGRGGTALTVTAQHLFSCWLLVCYQPGYFGDIDILILHVGIPIGLWCSYIMFCSEIFKMHYWLQVGLVIMQLAACILAYTAGPNSVTMLILVPIVPAVLLGFYILFFKLSGGFERTLFFIAIMLGARDGYITYCPNQTAYFTPIIVFILAVLVISRGLRSTYSNRLKMHSLIAKRSADMKMLSKLSEYQERYRAIFHDIKSPLSALKLVLSQTEENKSFFIKVSNKISHLLETIESEGLELSPDWLSISIFENCIAQVIKGHEKTFQCQRFRFNYSSASCDVFFNVNLLTSILDELAENSSKATNKTNAIEVSCCHNNEKSELYLIYQDCRDVSLLSGYQPEKGLSHRGGSGLGLFGIQQKMELVGGESLFKVGLSGAYCRLTFRTRNLHKECE